MDLEEKDVGLKILRGSPIDIGVGKVYPLILDEIVEIGELKYNQYLSYATFNQKDIVIEDHTLTPFEVCVLYSHHDINFRDIFLSSLSAFFKEPLSYHGNGFFYLGELEEQRFIDEQKYNETMLIIKKQNFLKDNEADKEFKPHNDRAAELSEKLKQIKSKIKEENNDTGLNLSDIISIVSAHMPNVSIFSVWGLTVFQLYTLYLRLILKDNYDSNFYLMPHVADSKSLDLKHWATKIQK